MAHVLHIARAKVPLGERSHVHVPYLALSLVFENIKFIWFAHARVQKVLSEAVQLFFIREESPFRRCVDVGLTLKAGLVVL